MSYICYALTGRQEDVALMIWIAIGLFLALLVVGRIMVGQHFELKEWQHGTRNLRTELADIMRDDRELYFNPFDANSHYQTLVRRIRVNYDATEVIEAMGLLAQLPCGIWRLEKDEAFTHQCAVVYHMNGFSFRVEIYISADRGIGIVEISCPHSGWMNRVVQEYGDVVVFLDSALTNLPAAKGYKEESVKIDLTQGATFIDLVTLLRSLEYNLPEKKQAVAS